MARDYLIIVLAIVVYFSPAIYQIFLLVREEKDSRIAALKKVKRIFKISVLIFIPICTILLTLNHTNYLNYSKPISFKNYSKITFKDFKGLEFFHKEFEGSKQFAYIVTTINYKSKKDTAKIEAYFHPSRSFVYDRNSLDKDLLSHELYHFKITEIYARKLRKIISEKTFNSEDEIEKVIKKYLEKERIYQQKYDYDTYHSYIYGEQKKYEKNIDSLLHLLIEYKNPKVKIHVKK